MKKWFSKILCGIMLLLMAFAFSGCKENKYNAILYSDCNEWFTAEFLENNKVYGAYYENPDYIEGESDINERGYYDKVSPKQRTICVTEETFNAMFLPNTLQVDFSKQAVWVYVFTANYSTSREYYIEEILENDKGITISYKLQASNKKGAVRAYQRCLVVTMDKTDKNLTFAEAKSKPFLDMFSGCFNDCSNG